MGWASSNRNWLGREKLCWLQAGGLCWGRSNEDFPRLPREHKETESWRSEGSGDDSFDNSSVMDSDGKKKKKKKDVENGTG